MSGMDTVLLLSGILAVVAIALKLGEREYYKRHGTKAGGSKEPA